MASSEVLGSQIHGSASEALPAPKTINSTAIYLKTIPTVVADAHSIVRQGLKNLLESTGSLNVVAEASSAAQLDSLIETLKPALVVASRQCTSLERLRSSAHSGSTRLLMLDHEGSASNQTSTESKSATTIVIQEQSTWNEFLSAVNAALGGKLLQHQPKSGTTNAQDTQNRDALAVLSKRERQVFFLLADGVPNRVIAKQLFVSPRTVETHRARVIKKLDLKSTAGLIKFAIRNQLMVP